MPRDNLPQVRLLSEKVTVNLKRYQHPSKQQLEIYIQSKVYSRYRRLSYWPQQSKEEELVKHQNSYLRTMQTNPKDYCQQQVGKRHNNKTSTYPSLLQNQYLLHPHMPTKYYLSNTFQLYPQTTIMTQWNKGQNIKVQQVSTTITALQTTTLTITMNYQLHLIGNQTLQSQQQYNQNLKRQFNSLHPSHYQVKETLLYLCRNLTNQKRMIKCKGFENTGNQPKSSVKHLKKNRKRSKYN